MKKFAFFLLALLFVNPIHAQLTWDRVHRIFDQGGSDSLIIKAIEPGLCIIRQQYQIRNKKKKSLHGKNGQNYFGESYSLGVKVPGGMMFSRRVLEPWTGDTDLDKVNNQNEYVPQLYKTTFLRGIGETDYKEANFDFDKPQYLESLGRDSLLFKHTEARSDFGLLTDESFGTNGGYMIWAIADSDVFRSDMHVELQVTKLQVPDSISRSLTIALKPSKPSQVLGGVFIQPIVDRVGCISCHLAGMAVPDGDGWVLRAIARQKNSGQKDKKKKDSEPRQDSPVNITPIKE